MKSEADIKIRKEYIRCNKCRGSGKIKKNKYFMHDQQHHSYNINTPCPKCKGDGYVDWVENIVGKKMSDNEKRKNEIRDFIRTGNWSIRGGSIK